MARNESSQNTHVPVMLTEVVDCFPRAGGVSDGTLAAADTRRRSRGGALHGLGHRSRSRGDRPRRNVAASLPGRLHLIHGQFGDMLDCWRGMASPR
jgi:hypothetical protein